MGFRGFLDANVLVPARTRDILLTLGEAALFVPLWSREVLDEMARHLPSAMDPDARGALVREMSRAFPEAGVGWPAVVTMHVDDLVNDKDQHVVAAALATHADVVVTEDLGLIEEIQRLSATSSDVVLDAQRADVFAAYACDVDPGAASAALVEMVRRRWLMPGDDGLEAPDGVLLDRLLRWLGDRGWSSTLGVLGRTSVRHG